MGGAASERLRWKEPLHSLEVELQREFGLSPVSSRALVRRVSEFVDTFVASDHGLRLPGQVSYTAVAIGERAGKPLRYCLTLPVALTLMHEGDAGVLHQQGSPALRRTRLARLCDEAYRQGAVLSHEDLALLMGVELSTVRRMVRDCCCEGGLPPTRGLIDDIGPTLSHKDQIIELHFRGLLPEAIAVRTGHSLGSVERYLSDFARVLALHRNGLAPEAITRITAMSPALVRRYLEMRNRYDRPANKAIIERLIARFGPLETGESVQTCMTGSAEPSVADHKRSGEGEQQ